MNDRTLLLLLVAIAAANLYISYRTARGLQGAEESVKSVKESFIGQLFGG